ncbi:hypothetical protein CK219_05335 [Mesorhizobium sp. WSM4313]|nr:hypothetical protein CK219_05335 [Mesorhizobium sp. WSM4313]
MTQPADILNSELADARERIHQTELALQRTEAMLAENIALSRKVRRLVDAAEQEINHSNGEGQSAG